MSLRHRLLRQLCFSPGKSKDFDGEEFVLFSQRGNDNRRAAIDVDFATALLGKLAHHSIDNFPCGSQLIA